MTTPKSNSIVKRRLIIIASAMSVICISSKHSRRDSSAMEAATGGIGSAFEFDVL